ncbi:MAG: exodeoxyribonuclease V subunit alpha [Sinobacteraceae bacterium]|nr:exodeoxyribonuclease V subunit alpha [Nevskiaceae bacterium]
MNDLQQFLADDRFTMLDRSLARHLAAQAPASLWIGHAAALLSSLLRRGHLCLELAQPPTGDSTKTLGATPAQVPWPSASSCREDLLRSGLVAEHPGEFKPLVLDANDRLYLHRYHEYERDLAERITERLEAAKKFSPVQDDAAVEAAIEAVRTRRFMVIAGGPGTGKTTTVVRLLIALLTEKPELRISLAAPTGKAAHRMQQSITAQLAKLPIEDSLRDRIPRVASTLHRLLGARGDSAFFRHDAARPLASDVVIVDESSMVDLPLMAKLFAALRAEARVILIGDPDQLASVEVGSVLADITAAGTRLGPALVTLRKPWRFSADSGIGALCAAIRAGDTDRTLDVLQGGEFPDVRLESLPSADGLGKALQATPVTSAYRSALRCDDPADSLSAFESGRILCATHGGPAGTLRINETLRDMFATEGLIEPRGAFYHRAPLVVLRNDYALQVFNGDSAVLTCAVEDERLYACFRAPGGELRRVLAARLPEHAPLYAMTVHRSQGSEFDHVLVVLPPHESPLLTRELLYTAVSRARKSVTIWADPALVRYACLHRVRRASGLTERLSL